jgi:hypothetical protein
MTQDQIILMADASGISLYGMGKDRAKFIHYLEAFAKLVAERALADPMREVQRLGQEIEERAWFTIAELNEWADKKLSENPHWVMPTEEPERKEALAQEKALQALHNENERLGLYRDAYAEQEPVAWAHKEGLESIKDFDASIYANGGFDDAVPLYTHPPQNVIDKSAAKRIATVLGWTPQRPWVGLMLTQVKLLGEGVQEEAIKSGHSRDWVFYTHINEALKEKNA